MNSMSMVGNDRKVVTRIVNQGIDARLEAFCQSKFEDTGYRLNCEIHPDEMTVLLRRLSEFESRREDDELLEAAENLLDDLVEVFYLREDE